jgi:uncharacterized protein with HEPN domain
VSGRRDESVTLDEIAAAVERLAELGRSLPEESEPAIAVMEGVLFNLIVLGEASKRLSPHTRGRFGDIPWSEMARTRDRVVHHYEGVDWDILRHVLRVDLPLHLPRVRAARDTLRAEFDARRH